MVVPSLAQHIKKFLATPETTAAFNVILCLAITVGIIGFWPTLAIAADKPISLSIKNADRDDARVLGPYCQSMRQSLAANWSHESEPSNAKAVVHFVINSNGELSFIELVESSGVKSVDSAALKAVLDANPLAPLPHFNKTVLLVNATFDSHLLSRAASSKYQNRSHAEDLAYSLGRPRRNDNRFSGQSKQNDWIEEDEQPDMVQRASISRRAPATRPPFNESSADSATQTGYGRNTRDETQSQGQVQNELPTEKAEESRSPDYKYIAPERLQYCSEEQIQRYLAQLHEFLQQPVTLPLR